MKYDFTTLESRKNTGSIKWEQMYEWNPNVADNIVPLSVADMELKPVPEVIEGLKKYLDKVILGYTAAYPSFLNSVISWIEKRHKYKVEKEWIVNTPGVVNAFYAAVNAFTNPGDGVIIFRPVYYPFSMAIEKNNRKIVNCPLIETDGYYTIDFEKLENLAKKAENKLIIFCSPHNPIGRVWKKDELKKLGEIAVKNNTIIVSDEIWCDIIMPGYEHFMMGRLGGEIEDNLILCTAPSKTFNLAGMATSNIIIKNKELRDKYSETLQVMRSASINILGYKACELAYTYGEEWLFELIKLIDTNQKIVKKFFDEKFPKIKARLIEGTYLQWIDFRALNLSNEELENFMHMEAEFFTDEGYIFGDEGSGYERINLAAPTWVIEDSLKRLEKALIKIYK
ncbi:MAG: MalY/PatB family protein [Fusobacterium sp.]|uniref:MalY/PatB family protein n=1 Tax=Fusobacterium sp. TaxID=68766 RepID=UPI0026DC9A5E|nr:MalY/PatB family protein [Fusobacterium sp.]MDO4690401.1 MalY/PatB family protein [Fusobacterium sp.]